MTETKPTKFVPKGEIVLYIHPQNVIITYGYLENLNENVQEHKLVEVKQKKVLV